MGKNSFLTGTKDKSMTFFNKCDCYTQPPDDGADDLFSKELIGQRLFFLKTN